MAEDEIVRIIKRMEAIGAGLPEADGVARFNHLYLSVTRAVLKEVRGGEFEDPLFLARFDVVFAKLYLAAVDQDLAGKRVGDAWRPLFDRRSRKRIAPVQFALAGMNAHINHDLAVALVRVLAERGLSPRVGTPQHRDFLHINDLLARVQDDVKKDFLDEMLAIGDEAMGRVDDVVAMWNVARARDAAWTNACTLWSLRRSKMLQSAFRETLDRFTGFASRGLLVPTL